MHTVLHKANKTHETTEITSKLHHHTTPGVLEAVGLLAARGLHVVTVLRAVGGAPDGSAGLLVRVSVDRLAIAARLRAVSVQHINHALLSMLSTEPTCFYKEITTNTELGGKAT